MGRRRAPPGRSASLSSWLTSTARTTVSLLKDAPVLLIVIVIAVTAVRIFPSLFFASSTINGIELLSVVFDVKKIQNGAVFTSLLESLSVSKQPPLVFLFYRALLRQQWIALSALNAVLDGLTTCALCFVVHHNMIWTAKEESKLETKMPPCISPRFRFGLSHVSALQKLVVLLYYCNPVCVLTSVSDSMQPLLHFLLASSLLLAQLGNAPLSMFLVASATYMSCWPVALVTPLVLWLHRSAADNLRRHGTYLVPCLSVGFFAAWLLGLLLLSYAMTGSWDFLELCYGPHLRFEDNTPNVGLYWYFFAGIFDRFRPFFVSVFHLMPFVFVAPLAFRFASHPTTFAASLLGIFSVLGPYPTMCSAMFAASVMATCPQTLCRLRPVSLYSAVAITVPVTLIRLDWHLWIQTGAGNANYLYFQTLAYSVFESLIFLDFISAGVVRVKAMSLIKKDLKKKMFRLKRARAKGQLSSTPKNLVLVDGPATSAAAAATTTTAT